MCNTNLSEYINLIENDKKKLGSYRRYPIRFIFFMKSDDYFEFVTSLQNKGIYILDLSTRLNQQDGWINRNMLYNLIKSIDSNKDCVITGFSELVRFYSKQDLETLLISLTTDIENNIRQYGDRRIYIPCFGLYNYIHDIFNRRFNRLNVFNPLIIPQNLDSEPNIRMFFTESDTTNILKDLKIKGVKEWLEIWKRKEVIEGPIICSSKTLNYWYQNAMPDNVFNIDKLNNEKEVIEKVFNIHLPINYDENEKSYWSKLLGNLHHDSPKSLTQTMGNIFNINNILHSDIVELWFANESKYKRWLLKHLVLNYNESLLIDDYRDYIVNIFKGLRFFDNEEILRLIWLHIFEFKDVPLDWYAQRKKLAVKINSLFTKHIAFESDLAIQLNKINDVSKLIKLITGITQTEKRKVIELYKLGHVSEEMLEITYPDFASYLSCKGNLSNENNITWIETYFDVLRKAKAINKYTQELEGFVSRYNSDATSFYKWFYDLKFSRDFLANNNIDRAIILDGIGLEYSLLIFQLLMEQNLIINQFYISKCDLPSISKVNRNFGDLKVEIIRDFDEKIIHKQYKYPDSIINALEYIRQIILNHVYVKNNERVAIVSDHGSSILHRLTENQPKYNFEDSEHDGRCMELKNLDIKENEDYFIYTNEESGGKWLISLRDVSLGNKKSIYEVHGGATPEEVMVPVFIVSRHLLDSSVVYKISANNLKISGLNRRVSFVINPKPLQQPRLVDEQEKTYFLHERNGVWETQLQDVRKQHIRVIIGESSEVFQVVTSFEEGDLF